MTSHLNYFEPYARASGTHHENDLTRAFLVLVDLVPMAMAEFLEQLRDRLPSAGYGGEAMLPRLSQATEPIDVVTQRGAEAVDTDKEWLVSVLMTNECLPIEEGLRPRDRGAIYDGVVTLDDHVVTLENKLRSGNVWMDQLKPDLPVPEERTIRWPEGARAVVVPWREMIGALVNLRDQGRLDPTAADLVGQFQRYVLSHFDYLNPYPNFAACHESEFLLNKRCSQILQALGGEERLNERSGHRSFLKFSGTVPARRLYLGAGVKDGEGYIGVGIHPGDLVAQARPLYRNVDRDGLLALGEDDGPWRVTPNPHLSYQGKHLVYTSLEPDLAEYLYYWLEHGDELIGRVEGDEDMHAIVARLQNDGWFAKADIEGDFRRHFAETQRNFVDVCPGLNIKCEWTLDEAQEIDDGKGAFVNALRERVEPVMALWGQSLPELGQG